MPWGFLTSIDLKNCDSGYIKDSLAISIYTNLLVKQLDMKAYGDPQIVHFGSCPEVEGFTLVQLIETSLISGHFINKTNEAFIDIFSCKKYDSKEAAEFTANYFGSTEMIVSTLDRGNWKVNV